MATIDSRLLTETEDELYLEIGNQLALEETGFLPSNVKAIEERGRRYVAIHLAKLKSTVCANKMVQTAAKNGTYAELVAAVAAAIESFLSGTCVAPVAALLCKMGIHKFCEREWSQA
jgi:hypothetical protein